MINTPDIGRALAVALCEDEHTGAPALDYPTWQGATDAARCAEHEGWAFCWDDEQQRLEAVNQDGDRVIWVNDPGYWEVA